MLNFKENNIDSIKQFLLTKEYVNWVEKEGAKQVENLDKFFSTPSGEEVPFSIENAYKYDNVKVKNAKEYLLLIDSNNLTENIAFQRLSKQFNNFKEKISKEEGVTEFIKSCDDEYVLPQFITEFEKSLRSKEGEIDLLPTRVIAAYLQLVRKELEDKEEIFSGDTDKNLIKVLHSISSKKEKQDRIYVKKGNRQEQALSFINIYNKNSKLFGEDFFENILTQLIAVDLIKSEGDINKFLEINKDFKEEDLKLVKKIFKSLEEVKEKTKKEGINLRTNQLLSVMKFLNSKKVYIDASDMGAGKSRTAIASIILNGGKRNLIICKKGEQEEKWMQEFNKIGFEAKRKLNPRFLKNIEQFQEQGTFILRHSNRKLVKEIIKLQKQNVELDLVVYDEPHSYFSNFSSQTYGVFSKLMPKKVMGLTGTPVKNKWTSFASMYSMLSGKLIERNKDITDGFGNILKDFYASTLFLGERDIGINLPKLSFFNHVIEDDKFIDYQKKIVESHKGNPSGLSLMHDLVKFTVEPRYFFEDYNGISKLDYLVELLNKLKIKGKTVVFQAIAFNPINGLLEQALTKGGIKHYVVNSSLNDGEKDKNLFKWRNDKENSVLIASISSFGEAVELYEATNVVFLQQPYNYSDKKQAIKRAHRLGQENSVEIHTLLMNNSIDVSFYKLLNLKRNLDSLLREGILSDETLNKSLLYRKETILKEIKENRLEPGVHLTGVENEDYEGPDEILKREVNEEETTEDFNNKFINMNTKAKHKIRKSLLDKLKKGDKILDLFGNGEFVEEVIKINKATNLDLKVTSIDFCLKQGNPGQLIENKEQEEVLKSYDGKFGITTKKIDLENFLLSSQDKFDLMWFDYMGLVNNDKLRELGIALNKGMINDGGTFAFTFYGARQNSNFTGNSYLLSIVGVIKELASRRGYCFELENEVEYTSTGNSKMIFLSFNAKKNV